MKIPKQLRKDDFRFVKCGHPDSDWAKRPIEKGWTKTNNYEFNHSNLQQHLVNKFNYGVLTGKGNLLVLDFDDVMFQTVMKKRLPKTFTVRSAGRGLLHMYYHVNKPIRKFPMRDEETGKTLCDVQCVGGQVIGANSMNKGKHYSIHSNISIQWVTIGMLQEAFGTYWKPVTKKLHLVLPITHSPSKTILTIKQFLSYINCIPIQANSSLYVDPVYHSTHKYNFQANNMGWYSYHSMIGGRKTVSLIMYYYDLNREDAISKYYSIMKELHTV